MGRPVEVLSALCNEQIRPKNHAVTPGWVCLSECCHGDDGLLRGMEHTLLKRTSAKVDNGPVSDLIKVLAKLANIVKQIRDLILGDAALLYIPYVMLICETPYPSY